MAVAITGCNSEVSPALQQLESPESDQAPAAQIEHSCLARSVADITWHVSLAGRLVSEWEHLRPSLTTGRSRSRRQGAHYHANVITKGHTHGCHNTHILRSILIQLYYEVRGKI